MAVFYKLYQDNRRNSKQKGAWYGRAKHIDTVTTEQLAEEMQENCTVKRADILAVISELVTTMQKKLQQSMAVRIDRLGTFKIGINTTAALTVKDFSPLSNVKGTHLLFNPETKIDKNGYRHRAMLTGVTVKELPKNDVKKESEGETVKP
ncbi:MAG: HU family DNA-binding protein [Prevotella sp.]|uniref:HU family DNA-binding protein n=1 Tax=Prevotella sp. TaxID=59823 RepID=UPI002A2DC808|nr:HU family DNA-binding protein [Prevotella sp.]MDD7318417.1 HU family DNA-binding protein [Prevotellaceae bacterium]MDY4020232.1 HU family DNA-binding protein [Prevotella sp.]